MIRGIRDAEFFDATSNHRERATRMGEDEADIRATLHRTGIHEVDRCARRIKRPFGNRSHLHRALAHGERIGRMDEDNRFAAIEFVENRRARESGR
jgi:hypothetical protein